MPSPRMPRSDPRVDSDICTSSHRPRTACHVYNSSRLESCLMASEIVVEIMLDILASFASSSTSCSFVASSAVVTRLKKVAPYLMVITTWVQKSQPECPSCMLFLGNNTLPVEWPPWHRPTLPRFLAHSSARDLAGATCLSFLSLGLSSLVVIAHSRGRSQLWPSLRRQ